MSTRLEVHKTYKLFINGQFPRSESGRTTPAHAADGSLIAHVSLATRKDLRDAVEHARAAQPKWATATAYNRGQILYRLAEMLEARANEFEHELALYQKPTKSTAKSAKTKSGTSRLSPAHEVAASIDRLVHYAGWADKHAQVLGGQNPVASPHYNFTVPDPTGVVAILCPNSPPLLALVSLLAPVLCPGNAAIVLPSQIAPTIATNFAEACATSDIPPGVVNILTADHSELIPHIASHRDIDAVHAACDSLDHAAALRAGAAENLKRVRLRQNTDWTTAQGVSWIEPFVEMKTIWHPASV